MQAKAIQCVVSNFILIECVQEHRVWAVKKMKNIHTYRCIYKNKHCNLNIMHDEAITIATTMDGQT